jgi:hypothetical protein
MLKYIPLFAENTPTEAISDFLVKNKQQLLADFSTTDIQASLKSNPDALRRVRDLFFFAIKDAMINKKEAQIDFLLNLMNQPGKLLRAITITTIRSLEAFAIESQNINFLGKIFNDLLSTNLTYEDLVIIPFTQALVRYYLDDLSCFADNTGICRNCTIGNLYTIHLFNMT